ncbi:D-glutamate cyclase family protein [Pseudomonas oryzihabitans]|uniref:D-glutamate cyclase family protein n=1 Tax=Pseudomonas oryzihabitans TaxID=47885 RepID=UPI00242E6F80|nr:DUF1445 domain-containing protein [Pseudomonas oryzihabitans]
MLVIARYPSGHGAPVHIGIPEVLSITDMQAPDFSVVPPMPPRTTCSSTFGTDTSRVQHAGESPL